MKAAMVLTLAGVAMFSTSAMAGIDASTLELIRDALAHRPDVRNGAAVYEKHCTRCHGARGWGDGAQAIPALAGQREPYLLAQLIELATRFRVSPEMHGVLSQPPLKLPQVWRDLSTYLSTQRPNRHAQHGDTQSTQLGEHVYGTTCAQCHGTRGEGSSEEPIPALRAQHYSYLVLQIRNFAAGHRSDVEPSVIDIVAGLSEEESAGVADYLSRLPAEK